MSRLAQRGKGEIVLSSLKGACPEWRFIRLMQVLQA